MNQYGFSEISPRVNTEKIRITSNRTIPENSYPAIITRLV